MVVERYHGQEIRDGRPTQPVPPPPPDFDPRRRPPPEHFHGHPIAGLDPIDLARFDAVGPPQREHTYPEVRLIGNYNLGCIDTQAVTYHNITPSEAHAHAWEAFGVCPNVILYFDANEQLVAKE
jgi:hypothetical protein